MKKIGNKFYADNFPLRRDIRKELVDHSCERCRRAYKSIYIGKKGQECKIVLVAHHPNNDTENPDAELIILCRACHGIAQRLYNSEVNRLAAEAQRKADLIKARLDAIEAGQLVMFSEIEGTSELVPCIHFEFPISQFLHSR